MAWRCRAKAATCSGVRPLPSLAFRLAPAAADAAEQDFINRSKGGIPDQIDEITLPLGEGGAAVGIAALLKSANLAASSGEGNRLIDGGGVRVDSNVVSDKGLKLGAGTYVLQVGKRKFARVTLA